MDDKGTKYDKGWRRLGRAGARAIARAAMTKAVLYLLELVTQWPWQ